MRKLFYALLCLACFSVGAYVWRVKSAGIGTVDSDRAAASAPAPAAELTSPTAVLVEVGQERITQEDVDWEYNLLTTGVTDKDSLTPIPDLGDRYQQELQTLKKAIVGNIVERKLLFTYVKQDRDFDFDNASRYSLCLADWQKTVAENGPAVQNQASKQRLKSRMCERSVLDQYLHERLFSGIGIAPAEIVEYFKNHSTEFKVPEQVELRQVLVPSEGEARKWRAQINARNFADIARAHSIAPEAEGGGRLGPFAKDRVPAVFEVAFHMNRGQISDVLKSNYGYHVIMLLNKTPKKELSLDEAKPKIVAILTKQKQEAEYSKWVEKALAAINVSQPKQKW